MTVEGHFFVCSGWKILLHDIGLDSDRILRRAELPGDLFARDREKLATGEYYRLWSAIEAEADDPAVALRMGSSLSVEAFDPPIFAALCSPDLNTALSRLALYKRLLGAMKLDVTIAEDGTRLELVWLDRGHTPPPVLVLTELVFFVHLARIGTREEVRPISVTSPVLPKLRRDFTRYLGVAMTRGDSPRIHFGPEDAARPFLTANEPMWQFFEHDLKKRLSQLDAAATTEERVHAALLELLPSGKVSVDAVAKKLGTGARTLQRRLKAEGYSFRTVLEQTREALARYYLKNSNMSGAEIAFLLGFEDPNSFFRAFNAWTGTTPESARREMANLH